MTSREGSPIERTQTAGNPSNPPKRPKFTYGRAKISPKSSPARDTQPAASSQNIAATDDDGDNSDSDAMQVEYDWKKKLREMDDMEGNPVVKKSVPGQHISPASPSRNTTTNMTASGPRHSSIERSPSPGASQPPIAPDSPVISHTRRARPTRRVELDSDSDPGVADRSMDSTISSTTQITAVPTSSASSEDEGDDSDEMPTSILPDSIKKKRVAISPPQMQPESENDSGEAGPSTSKSKRTTRSKASQSKRKIKAPTKKERIETVKDRARIADSRDIRIERTNRNVYTIEELAKRLAKNKEAATQQEPSSEDIDQFTSPARKLKDPATSFSIASSSAARPFGAPVLLASQSKGHFPLSPSKNGQLPAEPDSEDEILDVAALRKGQTNPEEERLKKLRQLREHKLRLVSQKTRVQNPTPDVDDDGDLLIAPPAVGSNKTLPIRQNLGEKIISSHRPGIKQEHRSTQKIKTRLPVRNTHAEINKTSMSLVQAQAIQSKEKRKAEFLSYGGRLKADVESVKSLEQVEHELAKNYRERVENAAEVYDGDEDEDEDEEYEPDDEKSASLLRGSASPEPDSQDEVADASQGEDSVLVSSEKTGDEDEDKENSQPRPRRRQAPLIINSDSEGEVQVKPLTFSSPINKQPPVSGLQPSSSPPVQSQSVVSFGLGGPLEFSQDDGDNFGSEPPVLAIKTGLGDLFDDTQPQISPPRSRENDPFAEFEPSSKKGDESNIHLTLGPTPAKPVLEVDQDLLRKADDIFEKEQQIVAQAAVQKPKRPNFYVNDYGFLTQTRPHEDAEVYQIPSSQHHSSPRNGALSSPLAAQRQPLQSIELSSPALTQTPLRRLRRRSSTPTRDFGSTNTQFFAPSPNKRHKGNQPLARSEFVVDEANESDDDEIRGFGLGLDSRREGDPEEEGHDLDRHDERLVNDAFMDEETLAEQKVKEKAREHEAEDDQKLEALHKAAVEGKLREKRRGRGLDLDDDSESEEDQNSVWRRRNKHKRRRKDNTLDNLAQDPEKAAFLAEYQKSIDDDPTEDHIFSNVNMEETTQAEEPTIDNEDDLEQPRVVTATDLRREIRQRLTDQAELGFMNPNDVSWMDKEASDEEDILQIRTVNHAEGAVRLDDSEMFPRSVTETEQQKRQGQSWAKSIGRNNNTANSGRLAGGAAVTGHRSKIKNGGGSLRNNGVSSAGIGTSKPVRPVPSFLSKVSDRAAAFQ